MSALENVNVVNIFGVGGTECMQSVILAKAGKCFPIRPQSYLAGLERSFILRSLCVVQIPARSGCVVERGEL